MPITAADAWCTGVQWAVRQTAEAENHMTSVERVLAYTQLPQERPATVAAGGGAPPKGWPSSAKLEFDRVEVCHCYRSLYVVYRCSSLVPSLAHHRAVTDRSSLAKCFRLAFAAFHLSFCSQMPSQTQTYTTAAGTV